MVELADTPDLGSGALMGVKVRVLSAAHRIVVIGNQKWRISQPGLRFPRHQKYQLPHSRPRRPPEIPQV